MLAIIRLEAFKKFFHIFILQIRFKNIYSQTSTWYNKENFIIYHRRINMNQIFVIMGKSSSGKDTLFKELLKEKEALQLEP